MSYRTEKGLFPMLRNIYFCRFFFIFHKKICCGNSFEALLISTHSMCFRGILIDISCLTNIIYRNLKGFVGFFFNLFIYLFVIIIFIILLFFFRLIHSD